ncbi:conserved hypothetical protein [Nitrosomonas eutropha C91]|uniref:Phage tail assembly chaperone n=3 Tax=Nitrosomonas eutropha TaxID=916 RepID=A0ABX5M8A7_9PROT|nr:conserved hypothetical protein [Nitrosomonas eutropha C91]PXV82493.1 phage tail assembly chaperone [Nitrosomonas eutropha]
MLISIESLKTQGGFSDKPVKRTITWRQSDEEFTGDVYVRPLSYASAVADLRSINDDLDPVASRIASSITDEQGKPIFTVQDITGEADPDRGALNGSLTIALLNVIAEVNGLGKQQS